MDEIDWAARWRRVVEDRASLASGHADCGYWDRRARSFARSTHARPDEFMRVLELGIAPAVACLRYPIMTRSSDMDDALADSRALFAGGWDEAAGRAVLEEILQRHGDELVFDGGVALSGVAHWQPRES